MRSRQPPGKRPLLWLVVATMACAGGAALRAAETAEQKYLVSVERIWDRPGHAAFTDLIAHDGDLYCTFREASDHVPGLNGTIRVIRSRDGANWQSVAVLAEQHVDLRDPKLSLAPDGRLMVNMGASYYHGPERLRIESRVAFSDSDGGTFGPPQRVEFPKAMESGFDWLWRVTWHEGAAWGCVQQSFKDRPAGRQRALRLVRSRDGVRFEEVAEMAVEAPSETTLRFLADGTLLAMIRCEGNPPIGRVGTSRPPYTDWKFVDSSKRFGGPNLVQLDSGAWLAGSRGYLASGTTTQLWWLDPQSGRCRDVLTLPSGGDTSYPGLVIDAPRKLLRMSYYSSHEGKAAIYLATLRLDALADSPAAKPQ